MFIANAFVKIINALFSVIGTIIQILLLVFPNSPFNINFPPEVSDIIGKANYFLPIGEMVAIAETWLVAIGIYYAYSVYARWAKTIE